MIEDLRKTKVKIIWNSTVDKIDGGNVVKSITIRDVNTNETKDMEIDGVFIECGEIPTTEIMKSAGLEVDEKNYIKVTSVPGVYAAGDVTGSLAQIVTAAAGGADAAMNAYLYMKGGFYGDKQPLDYGSKKAK